MIRQRHRAWRHLLIDTKGQLAAATVAAIRAASLVVSPVRPSLFDLLALKDTVRLIERADRHPKTFTQATFA
jgi:cellulose biosynthesis protein BcsQ